MSASCTQLDTKSGEKIKSPFRGYIAQQHISCLMDNGKIRKRTKYIRPCDLCARHKLRCDDVRPCTRCESLGARCTDLRQRKKPGPKLILPKEDILAVEESVLKISYDRLAPYLNLYKRWFYEVWPVVSIDELSSLILRSIQNSTHDDHFTSYALGCALCAAISKRIGFVTSSSDIRSSQSFHPGMFATEATRVRYVMNHREHPCVETLLTCFFLYCYYGILDGKILTAISYLREAILIAQVLRLHESNTYNNLETAKKHANSKIHYLLYITERYIRIEDNIPTILDESVPYPSPEEEEDPHIMVGFLEMIKIFSSPRRLLFEIINRTSEKDSFERLLSGRESLCTPEDIIRTQGLLQTVNVTNYMSEILKVNVLLSQHWMRSLTWDAAENHFLLTERSSSDSLSFKYPIEIAKTFLTSTSSSPLFAFEANGRGVSLKLLDIASSVAKCHARLTEYGFGAAPKLLEAIFELVKNMRCITNLPSELQLRISDILEAESLTVSRRLKDDTAKHSHESDPTMGLTNYEISDVVSPSNMTLQVIPLLQNNPNLDLNIAELESFAYP